MGYQLSPSSFGDKYGFSVRSETGDSLFDIVYANKQQADSERERLLRALDAAVEIHAFNKNTIVASFP